jgi:hypothetical protein
MSVGAVIIGRVYDNNFMTVDSLTVISLKFVL